jgi:hypothetical protein
MVLACHRLTLLAVHKGDLSTVEWVDILLINYRKTLEKTSVAKPET